MGTHTIALDDAYGQRHGPKREEYVDQRLMDELKKGMHITSFDYTANLIGECLPGLYLKTLEIPSYPWDSRLPARLARVLDDI